MLDSFKVCGMAKAILYKSFARVYQLLIEYTHFVTDWNIQVEFGLNENAAEM